MLRRLTRCIDRKFKRGKDNTIRTSAAIADSTDIGAFVSQSIFMDKIRSMPGIATKLSVALMPSCQAIHRIGSKLIFKSFEPYPPVSYWTVIELTSGAASGAIATSADGSGGSTRPLRAGTFSSRSRSDGMTAKSPPGRRASFCILLSRPHHCCRAHTNTTRRT